MMNCNTCGEEKSLADFYKSVPRKCKECVKAGVRANRELNAEHYRAYDNGRSQLPHRVAARAAYSQTDAGKLARTRAARRWIEANPRERAAQVALGNAVRDGRVLKWPTCAVPECLETRVEGHHPDYDSPLEVVWLCAGHHDDCHLEELSDAQRGYSLNRS